MAAKASTNNDLVIAEGLNNDLSTKFDQTALIPAENYYELTSHALNDQSRM